MMTERMMAAALVALAAVGCAMKPDVADIPADRRVTIAADLASDMLITDISCARGSGGHLEFQANVVNNAASDRGVEWRIVWLDANGLEIESAVSTWAKLMVAPKDIAMLKGVSPSQAAADMRLYVRRLRR